MALGHNPSVVRDGMVFYFDANNTRKSWRGKPTTNLILYSEEFDNSANWGYSNCGVTKVNNIIAPDGSRNVYAFYGNSSNTYHTVYQLYSYVSGRTYTQSIYAKAGLFTSCFMQFNPSAFGSWIGSTFDLVNGTASDPSGSITNVGNGWYRCSVTATATASSSQPAVYFYSSNSPYVGTNTGTQPEVYIYGGQLEESTFATGYIRTTSAAATRSNTQAILDLTNNNTITANSLTYNTDGTFTFATGVNYCTISNLDSLVGNVTLEAVVDLGTANGPHQTAICTDLGYRYGIKLLASYHGNMAAWAGFGSTDYLITGPVIQNTGNNHICLTRASSTGLISLYRNGELVASGTTTTGNMSSAGSSQGRLGLDYHSAGYGFNGKINLARAYNRELSATEVLQNFNAQRDRYGV